MSALFHPEADAEFSAAADWYEAEKVGLGISFREAVREAERIVLSNPIAFEEIGPKGCRQYILAQFPYSLIYVAKQEPFFVVAVAHHKRKPGYWRTRVARS